MTNLRSEANLLWMMATGPALLLIADAMIYSRTLSVLAVPGTAALMLFLLGTFGLVRMRRTGASITPDQFASQNKTHVRQGVYLAIVVLGLLLLGPRIGLPVFGFAFPRVMGASWSASLAMCAVCATMVELILVRALDQPLILLPIIGF